MFLQTKNIIIRIDINFNFFSIFSISVQILAIFLWYSSKGNELHDKDFGLLTKVIEY